MKQTEDLILEIGRKIIEKYYTNYYNSNKGIKVIFEENESLLKGFGLADSWGVSFWYGAEDYGRDVLGIVTIRDEDAKPLYIQNRNGVGEIPEEDLDGIWPLPSE
jgi:hypothetical protein